MKARRGSFGGAAGAWMRKRRKKPTQEAQGTASASTTTSTTATITTSTDSKTASIVWDEERCRVVYESAPSTTTSNDSDDVENVVSTSFWTTAADFEQDATVTTATPTPTPRVSTEKPNDFLPLQQQQQKYQQDEPQDSKSLLPAAKKARGKRSYASRKRGLPLQSPPPPLSQAQVLLDTASTRRANKRTKKDLLDFCHEMDNDVDTVPPVPVPVPVLVPTKSRPFKTNKQKQNTVALSLSQPSSNTSLEDARSFFAQLDANQPLNLDHSETASAEKQKQPCIRTRRRGTAEVTDPLVHKEYNEYVAACQESGLAPRPVHEMLHHKSTFFRTTVIYDGFLDE